ncbi:MAG: efflux RND transporter periplasmic adaptor subunit [Acidobacteriota bacterium]
MNMRSTYRRQHGAVTRGQLIAMAVILACGLGAGLYVMKGKAPASPSGSEGEHHQSRSEHATDTSKEIEPPHDEHEEASDMATLSDAQIKAANIELAQAGPGMVHTLLALPGEIRFNDDRTAHIVPKVAGVAESVFANLGQQVRKGQVLAVIASPQVAELRSELLNAEKRLGLARTTYQREKKLFEDRISPEMDVLQARQAMQEAEIAVSNANEKLTALGARGFSGALNRFELRAPFDATVVEKHLALGEAVKEDTPIMTLSDLSVVWAELKVSAQDLTRLHVGNTVQVQSTSSPESAQGKVAYVGALIGEQTRTAVARVVLPNPKFGWRPGLFVNVQVQADQKQAAVTVKNDAIHELEGKQVVFVRVKDGFKAQPVELGGSDGQLTEVVKGLKAGESYAAANSFVIKADIGKSSAEHEH